MTLYEEVVGLEGKVDSENYSESGDVTTMTCSIYSGGIENKVQSHTFSVEAVLYQDGQSAEEEFKNDLDSSGAQEHALKNVSGAWDEGYTYTIDDTYSLEVRSSNLVVRLNQGIDPFEAIKSKGATKLMTETAARVLDGMRRLFSLRSSSLWSYFKAT